MMIIMVHSTHQYTQTFMGVLWVFSNKNAIKTRSIWCKVVLGQGWFKAASMQNQPIKIFFCGVQYLCEICGVQYWLILVRSDNYS